MTFLKIRGTLDKEDSRRRNLCANAIEWRYVKRNLAKGGAKP
jgi:hypothetical protein